jgi:MFS transporter, OFA family, oxalate/formate antiporter
MLKDYFHFAGNNRHFLLFGLITAFFGNYGQSFFIAWFGASFQISFDLSNTQYGSIYSTATLISGFLIMYAGGLLDKTPLRKFTLLSSLGLASACFLLFFSEAIWQLILAIFLLRFCGQGLMFHIAYTSMARYFEKNRGKAIGIVGFGMPIGEALLPPLAAMLILTIGWRYTWLAFGISILCLFMPLMIWLLKQSAERLAQFVKSEQTSQQTTSWSRAQVVKDKRFWLLIPAIMSPAFIVTGVFIHQGVLLSEKNWSEEFFAFSFSFYAVSHLLASLIIGGLVDKYSGKTLLRYYLIPMFIGLALLALPSTSNYLALAFMFLTGITIGASGPIVGSLWVEVYGNQSIAAIRSMVTSIMVVSTAISPILFGYLFDQGHSYFDLMSYLMVYILMAWIFSDRIAMSRFLQPNM